jgi:hypothetical protein
MQQMWPIKAQTADGRRAKVSVLLSCVMPDDWLAVDDKAEWEIRTARELLFEFVGGESGDELR